MVLMMQRESLSAHLSHVMDALVNADSLPYEPDVGLTLWQTAWVTMLFGQWQGTASAQSVLQMIENLAHGREGDFEDELFTMAYDVWVPCRNTFYAAGFQFGQQYAMVDSSTRMTIAIAIASIQSGTWAKILESVATDDLWEKALVDARGSEEDAKDATPGAIAWRKWDRALEELRCGPDVTARAVGYELDAVFNESVVDLQQYMFHQGRLDGEALGGGGAR